MSSERRTFTNSMHTFLQLDIFLSALNFLDFFLFFHHNSPVVDRRWKKLSSTELTWHGQTDVKLADDCMLESEANYQNIEISAEKIE